MMGSFFNRYSKLNRAKNHLKLLSQKEGRVELIKNHENGFAEIVIENSKKRNAINGKMMLELSDAISSLENWKEGKCVLIRGAGNTFCSGGDIDFVKIQMETASKKKIYLSSVMTDSLLRLSKLNMITAAYIDGTGALGGGAELASSVDFRIMHPSSNIGFVHKRMGIIPAWGGVHFLKNITSERQALSILLHGKVYNAEEALKINLIDFVEDSEIRAREKLLKIVGNAHYTVITNLKKSIFSTSLEEQGQLCAELAGGEQHLEALDSFMKRVKKTK